MNRSRPEPPRSRHPWLITFADLMMVVLILFVLLYSYSDTNTHKFESVVGSFQSHSIFDGEFAPVDPEGITAGGIEEDTANDVAEADEDQTTVPEDMEDRLAEMIAREENIQEILDYVHSYAAEHDLQEQMTVAPTSQGIEVVLPEVMLFPSGQADLIDEAVLFLEDMAPLLSDISNPIEVEGHTDNRPISTERFPSNWDLSTARANEVIRYLVEEEGLQPERFKAVGYGEYQPVASNDTEEGRSQNRRVILLITDEEISA